MVRRASDNKYLHRDFHNIMNLGLVYLSEKYGDEAVRSYLRQFASAYHSPLTEKLRSGDGRGALAALAEHFRRVYELEEASDDLDLALTERSLTVTVRKCPAVTHMRRSGVTPSPLYHETLKTVNETICEGTPVRYQLLFYNPETGASVGRFCVRGGDCP